MFWSVLQIVGKQGIMLLVFSILALFLNPADFGILGMAMAWIAFIQVFSEIGFGAALIQRQEISSGHFSSIYFMNVFSGLLLTGVGIVLSWPSALFFKSPEVRPVAAVLSMGFMINAFSLTHLAIAQREMRFRDLAIRDLLASLAGGTVGIVMAWLRFGVWSLVAQSLVMYFIGSVMIWHMSQWRPKWSEFSLQRVKDLWGYSSKIFSFQLFKYFSQNLDKLMIGYFLGSVALGLYTFAFKITVYPISAIVGSIGNYLFSKYSRLQDNIETVKASYLLIYKAISNLIVPLMIIIVILSPIVIPLIFGPKWIQAVSLIQLLAPVAIVQSLISPIGQLMKAFDRPQWLLNWSVFFTVMTSFFLWLGTQEGILGVAVGLIAVHVLVLPVVYAVTAKLIPINIKLVLQALFPAVASSTVLGLLLWSVLNFDVFSVYYNVVAGLIVSVVSYILVLAWMDKAFVSAFIRRFARA